MPTFGQAITAILVEIINSTIGTAVVITRNIILMFRIIMENSGRASPLALLIAAGLLFLVLYGIFKFIKSESRTMIVALLILAVLGMLVVLLRFV